MKHRQLAVLLLIFLFPTILLAKTSQMTFDRQKPGFTIQLPANPTTGYQWTLISYDKEIFQLKQQDYTPANTNLVGSGGQARFVFALQKGKAYPDKTSMVLRYARPWEKAQGEPLNLTLYFK